MRRGCRLAIWHSDDLWQPLHILLQAGDMRADGPYKPIVLKEEGLALAA